MARLLLRVEQSTEECLGVQDLVLVTREPALAIEPPPPSPKLLSLVVGFSTATSAGGPAASPSRASIWPSPWWRVQSCASISVPLRLCWRRWRGCRPCVGRDPWPWECFSWWTANAPGRCCSAAASGGSSAELKRQKMIGEALRLRGQARSAGRWQTNSTGSLGSNAWRFALVLRAGCLCMFEDVSSRMVFGQTFKPLCCSGRPVPCK